MNSAMQAKLFLSCLLRTQRKRIKRFYKDYRILICLYCFCLIFKKSPGVLMEKKRYMSTQKK